MYKGKLIVFEGIDCSGKSTLAKELYNSLVSEGKEVVLTCQPSKDTSLGSTFRELALKRTLEDEKADSYFKAMLFMADRVLHFNEVILPALKEGKIVICDRWWYSTIVYQLNYFGNPRSAFIEINQELVKRLVPDLIFYCHISRNELTKRLNSRSLLDGIERDVEKNPLKYYAGYEYIFSQKTLPDIKKICRIDTSGTIDYCSYLIRKEVDRIL